MHWSTARNRKASDVSVKPLFFFDECQTSTNLWSSNLDHLDQAHLPPGEGSPTKILLPGEVASSARAAAAGSPEGF